MIYDILRDEWRLDLDLSVNYLAAAGRAAG
jgi:hypothetical protein